MERPRYRGDAAGGGSSAAWNGTCGHPRPATAATSATSATGTGPAGDDDDESGERDPPVPGPGSAPSYGNVPKPGSVPNPQGVTTSRSVPDPCDVPNPGGVSCPRSVPNAEDVPSSGSVPDPGGVPNSGSVPSSGSVPKPGGVANPGGDPSSGSVPDPGGVPNSGSVPNSGGVPSSGSVPSPGGVPSSGSVPNPGGVANPRSVPNSGGVTSSGSVPNSGSVPSPKGVAKPGSVPSSGSTRNPGDVPNPSDVPNPDSVPKSGHVPYPADVPNSSSVPTPGHVPTPGGRCGCRGPPAAPPSPSRVTPCGLGCHRHPPESDGDTQRPRRRPRQHRDEPGDSQSDTGGQWRGSLRVARAGVALCLRLLGALLALLLLLLLLILGALRRCSAGLRRCREWLQQRVTVPAVPSAGDEEEVTRLVAMAEVAEEELDPFRVLGVEPTASDAELRRAYRRLAVLVHPDKSRDPRAEAAFKVLRAGWDRVSSPERRREYQTKQLAQGELAQALGAFLGRLQEELRDAMDAMGCSRCGGRHRRFPLARDPRRARYCAQCRCPHAAEDGDLWAESSLLGLKVTYLARMDGRVYDVTEWAGCQRVAISPDSHRVPYHLSFGARTAPPAGQRRATPKGSAPSPADLQEFLARVFQGNSVPGETGGAFPTPGAAGPPPGPPSGPPRPEAGVAPRGDAKHKRRKKGRRPLPR